MNREFYIYLYWRLDTNEVFYVGKGKGDRWKVLSKSRRNKHFINIINKYPVVVEIIKDNLTENEAFYWEEEIIKILVFEYGYSINIANNYSNEEERHLVNMTWGGEGTSGHNPLEGKSEEEIREIMELRRKNMIETKNKNGWGGTRHPMYGKHHTEETKEKISDKMRGRKLSENHKEKLSKIAPSTSVICLTTLNIFLTIKKAAKYYDCKASSISRCCKGYCYNKNKKVKVNYAGKLPDGTKLAWMYLEDFLNKCKYILL